eukprot:3700104-Amphidinium_carterae.2
MEPRVEYKCESTNLLWLHAQFVNSSWPGNHWRWPGLKCHHLMWHFRAPIGSMGCIGKRR